MAASVELLLGLAGVIGVTAVGMAALPWSAADIAECEASFRTIGAWLWAHRPSTWWRPRPVGLADGGLGFAESLVSPRR
jgi:hypothetical protein